MTTLRGFILLVLLSPLCSTADEIPHYAEEVHLGVASCASGVCHGSVRPRDATPVLQNEYVVWSRLDRHRTAYQTLLSEESQWIARNLGLENAHEADVCLDCHADNVPAERRGAKFQISDGIGCEACHGGGEHYLMSHTDPEQTHEENIAQGLYPTDRVAERATLCFSCHIGNEQKIASHEIMGAGHPRLSFELDTFTILQPAHFVVDEDYVAEKWAANNVTVWALGQVEAGLQSLHLIESHLGSGRLFPELSLFDCHACHHAMSDLRWEPQKNVPLPPGSVRLNMAGFVLLMPISAVIAPDLNTQLKANLAQLHVSVDQNAGSKAAISEVRKTLEQLRDRIGEEMPVKASLLDQVVAMGQRGDFRDYVSAEQAVMAVDVLLNALEQREARNTWVDSLYETVAEEDAFDPYAFKDVIGRF